MAEKTIDIAQESSVQEVNQKIGSTGDTGGSTAAGSLFGKLNAILTNWTSTRAGYIDTINTNAARLTSARATIIDNIGATGNTGGTTSAGTVMAKLNALITNTTANNTASTTGTLSQKLTAIYNQIGATSNTGGSATAGTVMGKLNAIITKLNSSSVAKAIPLQPTIVASNNVLHTVLNSEKTTTTTLKISTGAYRVKNASGRVRISASLKTSNASYPAYLQIQYSGGSTSLSSNTTSYSTSAIDITLNEGQKIDSLTLSIGSNRSAYCNLITICGDFVYIEPSLVKE